jgi:ATP-binding cassette, subfamily B, bacterial PglK
VHTTIRKVYELFDRRERGKLVGLSAMIVLLGLVQMAGVASILPFMSLVANPEIITTARWAQLPYTFFGFESTRSFLIFAGGLVLAVMTFSNALAAGTSWLKLRFVRQWEYRLSVRLLEKYLHAPYTFHLKRNSSTLAKTILSEVREVISRVFLPVTRMFAAVVTAACMVALLLVVDTQLALLTGLLLGGAYGGLYAGVRNQQHRWGKVRKTSNRERFKAAAEALGGIKEAIVLGCEKEFLKRFSVPALAFSRANTANSMVLELPKYALDTITFGGILLVVLYILGTREDFGQAIGVLSLYALAAYRLKPAMKTIFDGISSVRFFGSVVDELHADLLGGSLPAARHDILPAEDSKSLRLEHVISIDGVCYRYPDEEHDVLSNVSLRIHRNSSVAFVGSTGSGKTTLIDVILGLIEPQKGCVRVGSVMLSSRNIKQWRQKLGYVPQQIYLCDDSICRNIAFGIPDNEIDFDAVQRAARMAQLDEFVSSLPSGYHTIVGERGTRLSGGQRQRIGIARALYHRPEVLILDEATSALDGITEEAVMQAVYGLNRRMTIIVVAHRLTTVRDCDAIYLLENGKVAAVGSYSDLMQTSVNFRAMARIASTESATV